MYVCMYVDPNLRLRLFFTWSYFAGHQAKLNFNLSIFLMCQFQSVLSLYFYNKYSLNICHFLSDTFCSKVISLKSVSFL